MKRKDRLVQLQLQTRDGTHMDEIVRQIHSHHRVARQSLTDEESRLLTYWRQLRRKDHQS